MEREWIICTRFPYNGRKCQDGNWCFHNHISDKRFLSGLTEPAHLCIRYANSLLCPDFCKNGLHLPVWEINNFWIIHYSFMWSTLCSDIRKKIFSITKELSKK
jgi:hypothetical protein